MYFFIRRFKRRPKRLVLFSAVCLVFIFMYILVFIDNHNIAEEHYRPPFSEKCLSTASERLINEICTNFSKGIAYGSLCSDLCLAKTIKVTECIHHATTYVLKAKNLEENIVIKKKKTHDISMTMQFFEESISGITRKEDIDKAYIERITDEVQSLLGADSREVFTKNLKPISKLLFGKQIEELTLEQLRNSWYLVGQDELIVMALHQDLESFPKLLGTCGSVYAMENIQPYSNFFPQIRPSIPWERRVKIAKEFLALLNEFEHSSVGRLTHCDMQEANFGLTKDLKVKAIDVDLIISPNRIDEILPQPQCTVDDECDFFDCNSKCDKSQKQCTAEQTTNNFMIMCRDIFYPKWPNNGLLTNFQPRSIKKRLNTLLEDCKSDTFGRLPMDHHTVQRVLNELENLLDS